MPEYTYLLETRLSSPQKNALSQVRDAAREAGMTVFLAGGAVRDLTTGSSVRDLDFSVQGNALELRDALQARGATFWGEYASSRTLFFLFPGSVRVEVASTRSETFPKPGQPVYEWSSIVDDLHRRDFTVNAMALSLNEGSYGLLLDPLNGVADIEARQLRLVSNYGFLEDPSRLVRLVRLRQRMGWTVEERTATRYENAKEAGNFDVLSAFLRGYELEEIAAEEDALDTVRALEAEGWMTKLFASWTAASADTAALDELRRNRIQLLMQGIAPDLTAAHLELLTAKMSGGDRDRLKGSMVRPGLRAQWEGLDAEAREFARLLLSKDAASPSATWKLFHSYAAEPILWLAHGRKAPAADAKFKNLFTVWPEVAKKVPVALMLEMRITPELPGYEALLHELFLQQIDGKLETDEALRAFLEPYSPPAPPPPVTLRRTRGKKGEAKPKRKGAAREDDDEDEDELDDEDRPAVRNEEEEEEEEGAGGPPELGLRRSLGSVDLDAVLGRIHSDEETEELPDLDRGEEVAGETAPPAPLVKNKPEAESVALPSSMKAAAAGSPPVTSGSATLADAPAEAPPQAKEAAPPSKPAKKVPVPAKAASDVPAPQEKVAEKKGVSPKKGEGHAPATKAVPAKGAPPAKKAETAPTPAKSVKAAAKKAVAKTPPEAEKKAAGKSAKPARKR